MMSLLSSMIILLMSSVYCLLLRSATALSSSGRLTVHSGRLQATLSGGNRHLCSRLHASTASDFGDSALKDSHSTLSGLPYFSIYYNDVYEVDMPSGHRFPMAKYRQVREAVQSKLTNADEQKLIQCTFSVSPLATYEHLSTTHCPEYIQRYLRGQMTESENRNIGFPWTLQHINRTLSSTGGTVAASLDAYAEYLRRCNSQVENAHLCWSAHVAGGTHHAFEDYGEGFCIFSDIAVAANVLLQKYPYQPSSSAGSTTDKGIRRILIIDLDVHQGNGNAKLFQENDRVQTFSVHCRSNYFSKKESSDLDVELPSGCTDETYLSTLSHWLRRIEQHPFDDSDLLDQKPFDFIFYQAGVDIHKDDRLGRLSISQEGISRRNKMVYEFAHRMKCPLTICMGGGYPKDDWSPIIGAHTSVYVEAHQYLSSLVLTSV